jgi:hypothetical protein
MLHVRGRTYVLSTEVGLPPDWKPATIEDAIALDQDALLYGNCFATIDGKRIDPETVTATPHKWTETHPDGSTTRGSFTTYDL